MGRALTVLRGVLIGVLCLILAVNLWLVAARLLLGQDLPKLAGCSQAVVLSGSMEPAFSAGDMLIFNECPAYTVGDVVIFRSGESFVTHRIVGERDGGFVTKGDANNTEDKELLSTGSIEGRLLLVVPGVGGALTFLRSPLGLLLLVLVGVALIESDTLLDLLGKRVKKDE